MTPGPLVLRITDRLSGAVARGVPAPQDGSGAAGLSPRRGRSSQYRREGEKQKDKEGKRTRRARHPQRDLDDSRYDLRLVTVAISAWLACALALGTSSGIALVGAGVAVGLALMLLGVGRGNQWVLVLVAALLVAAAAAVVAACHTADLRRGPLPPLARAYGHADVELTVNADPRSQRPRVRGENRSQSLVFVEGTADRVTAKGHTTAVRNPILVIAQGPGSSRWLRLLPSTQVRVTAELAPSMRPGKPFAAVLRVRGAPTVVGHPTAVQRAAGRLRAGLRVATDGLPPDARALLPGLVVGDTSRLSPELVEDFRLTDLSHLLAVSGANLTIVLALLIGPPRRAALAERGGLAPRLGIPLRATAVLGGLLTLGFVVLCRPDPSVLRAASCGLITLLAIATGRRHALLPALAATVLLLVLFFPWLARSYGFVLSVLATGALLTIAPRWGEALRRRGVPGRLAEVLAAASAAQAVCAPVVAVLAARVSLVAVPCNLLAELAVAPATVLGFAGLAAAPVSMPVAEGLVWLAAWPTEWLAAVARTGAALPGAAMGWPGGWTGGLLLALVVLISVAVARRLMRSGVLIAMAALLLLVALLRPVPLSRLFTGWPPPGWRLVACDVGQGDALVLATGEGQAVVVDTGPDPRLMDGCLRDLGITRIPLLVLSHFHADHVAGLPGVLRGRSVGAIQTTGIARPAGQRAWVTRAAHAAEVPVFAAAPGERRVAGGLSWEVLWPPVHGIGDSEPNNASVVMLFRVAGLTVMLPGDLEPPAQRRLMRQLPPPSRLPRVDVLKVAHHGSAFQDHALLRRLNPRLAIISCGQGNPYGHPSPTTVTALRGYGATVLRTDRHGAVAVLGGRHGLSAVSQSWTIGPRR